MGGLKVYCLKFKKGVGGRNQKKSKAAANRPTTGGAPAIAPVNAPVNAPGDCSATSAMLSATGAFGGTAKFELSCATGTGGRISGTATKTVPFTAAGTMATPSTMVTPCGCGTIGSDSPTVFTSKLVSTSFVFVFFSTFSSSGRLFYVPLSLSSPLFSSVWPSLSSFLPPLSSFLPPLSSFLPPVASGLPDSSGRSLSRSLSGVTGS